MFGSTGLPITGCMTVRGVNLCLCALLSSTAILPASMGLAQEATGEVVELRPIVIEDGSADSDTIVAQTNTSGGKVAADTLDTAASVSVITSKEIEDRGVQTLEEALSYTAGVLVDEFGGGEERYDGYRIRGFDQQTTGTYRDGLPYRGFGWTYGKIEAWGQERIEVLKGSNSALYGLNAPGGLVNAVAKKPRAEAFHEIYSTLGEDHTEVGFDFGDTLSPDGKLSYRVTGKVQDAETGADYSQDDRRYLAFAMTWAPTDATELTFLADYNNRDGWPGNSFPVGLDVDPATFFGEPDYNRFDTIDRGIGWQLSHSFGNGLTFRQNARYSRMTLDYEQVYSAALVGTTMSRSAFDVASTSRQFAIDNQLEYVTSFGNVQSRTLGGLEFTRLDGDELVQFGVADSIDVTDITRCGLGCITLFPYKDWTVDQKTKSAYVQQELTIADRWIATFGGRYDMVDIDAVDTDSPASTGSNEYESFTKRIGLTYKARPDLSFYANYSESFEPDLWAISSEPKEGQQYEIGVKYRPEGMNALFTAAAFDLTQTNITSQISPLESRQIGKVGVRGVELEGKVSLNERLDVTAAYTYLDAEILEDGIGGNVGNRPSRVADELASIWASYKVPGAGGRGDMTLGLGVRYVGDNFGDDANTVSVPSYTLVDAAIGYEISDQAELALNVSNLFDKEYITSSYYGSEYYGDGRTVLATLRYTW